MTNMLLATVTLHAKACMFSAADDDTRLRLGRFNATRLDSW